MSDVSILTRLEGRVQRCGLLRTRLGVLVSILTRLEGRVQHCPKCGVGNLQKVSILTRLEGRVQRMIAWIKAFGAKFQSSPDSKVGCNAARSSRQHLCKCFNPHPTRRSGATRM